MLRTAVVICFLLLSGACSEDKNPVREYGSTLTNSYQKAEKMKLQADLVAIKAELQRYKAENGTYPPSLQALNLSGIHQELYTYDSESGTVAVK